jgi:prepilin-type N-terminal cleavage/methylation domain-containing protein
MKAMTSPMTTCLKPSRYRRNSSSGFSLVEVLIAAVIGGIMVTTMADMSNFSNRMLSKSASKSEAQVSLNSQIEQLEGGGAACEGTAPLPPGITQNIVPEEDGCTITFAYADDSDSKNNFERTVVFRLKPGLDP